MVEVEVSGGMTEQNQGRWDRCVVACAFILIINLTRARFWVDE
jgi:hypothetical protein